MRRPEWLTGVFGLLFVVLVAAILAGIGLHLVTVIHAISNAR